MLLASLVSARRSPELAETKVPIFLDQTTTSRDNPDPVETASSVMVGLTKVGPRRLISWFDPL